MRVIYGVNPVMEALRSPDRIERIMIADSRADKTAFEVIKTSKGKGIDVKKVPNEEIDRLTGTRKHQGIAAVLIGEFVYKDIEDLISIWKRSNELAFFLILDSIQDPQNLGSLIRTANAAGMHGIIIPKDRATEVTPAVVKASAGATEHVAIARETNLTRAIERLKEENVWIAGIEADCREDIYTEDLKRDLAIVVGSEGKGIRRLVRESCDFCLSIPMAGKVNSLNAAQAGAVAMFEARRQRMKKN